MFIGGGVLISRERKPPKMTGPFAQVAEDFIQYKRSCGFKYENEPKCMSRVCRFAEEQGVTSVKDIADIRGRLMAHLAIETSETETGAQNMVSN